MTASTEQTDLDVLASLSGSRERLDADDPAAERESMKPGSCDETFLSAGRKPNSIRRIAEPSAGYYVSGVDQVASGWSGKVPKEDRGRVLSESLASLMSCPGYRAIDLGPGSWETKVEA